MKKIKFFSKKFRSKLNNEIRKKFTFFAINQIKFSAEVFEKMKKKTVETISLQQMIQVSFFFVFVLMLMLQRMQLIILQITPFKKANRIDGSAKKHLQIPKNSLIKKPYTDLTWFEM